MLFAPSGGGEESDALRTIPGGEELEAAHDLQETQRTVKLNAPCTRRPLAGPAVRRSPRSTQLGTWPGNEAAAAPVTAVHTDMGVRATAPSRTESSILVPMATKPVPRTARVQRYEPAAGSDATCRA
eukprot:5041733-Pleurochrysis_carterae.AAC.2